MNRNRCLVLLWSFGLVYLAFLAGEKSVSKEANLPAFKAVSPKVVGTVRNKGSKQASTQDTNHVLVENFGLIHFTELYDLLKDSAPAQWDEWGEELDGMPDGPKKLSAQANFYSALIQIDADTASRLILSISNHFDRSSVLTGVVKGATNAALPGLGRLMVQLTKRDRQALLPTILAKWVCFAPSGAVKFVEENESSIPPEGYNGLLKNWVFDDVNSARAWLEAHPRILRTTEAVDGLMVAWRITDSEGALKYAIAHAEEASFQNSLGLIFSDLYRKSPEQAKSVLTAIPADAANEVVERIAKDSLGGNQVGKSEFEKFGQWLLEIPGDTWRSEVYDLIPKWSSIDADGTRRWIRTAPEDIRDELALAYCNSHADQDNRAALEVAFAIKDGELQNEALVSCAMQAGETRPARLAWLQSLKLPSSQKVVLEEIIRQNENDDGTEK